MKKYLAEFLGTYALLFCGAGAIVIDQIKPDLIGHMGISITFGLIVMAMIYSFGGISGTHINPAVSIGFALIGQLPLKDLFPYILAQCLGALAACFTLKALFPHVVNLGMTLPSGGFFQSFILEIILTYFLMLCIVMVSQQTENISVFTGLAVGMMVWLEALFAGPISGASMNPARSLGPAIASFHFEFLWIYLSAPVIGAVLGSLSGKYFLDKNA